MIPYFHALFIQRHGMISAQMIYGHHTYRDIASSGQFPQWLSGARTIDSLITRRSGKSGNYDSSLASRIVGQETATMSVMMVMIISSNTLRKKNVFTWVVLKPQ